MGKYYTQGDKVLMPLAIQVHHAVCDGFHVGRNLASSLGRYAPGVRLRRALRTHTKLPTDSVDKQGTNM